MNNIISREEFQKILNKKPSKMRNIRVVIDGIKFASTKEGNRYIVLKHLVKQNLIKDLVLQPRFIVCDPVEFEGIKYKAREYRADFKYYDKIMNKTIVEDVKGRRTDLYILKRNIFLLRYPQYTFKET